MGDILYLFYAFSITWVLIFIYMISLSRRQKSLERELEKIKAGLEKA